MKIGIIGSGMIGGTAAKLFAEAGHFVAISNSRGSETLADLVQEIGPQAQAVSVEEAAKFGEVVLVAIPYGKYKTLPAQALAGKIVVDAMNYYPQRDGEILFEGLTSSELVAQHLVGARMVKAFNTIYFQRLATQGQPQAPVDQRLAIFVAGDDGQAKATVSQLIEEIGFGPVDTGNLREGGRRQQPGTEVYNQPMTREQALEILKGR